MVFRIKASGMPGRHAAEVGPTRVRIANALDDRELPRVQKSAEAAQRRVQTKLIVNANQAILGKRQAVSISRITFVAERDDGVDAVIAAVELNDDKDAGI